MITDGVSHLYIPDSEELNAQEKAPRSQACRRRQPCARLRIEGKKYPNQEEKQEQAILWNSPLFEVPSSSMQRNTFSFMSSADLHLREMNSTSNGGWYEKGRCWETSPDPFRNERPIFLIVGIAAQKPLVVNCFRILPSCRNCYPLHRS